jgi:hypothetical protein
MAKSPHGIKANARQVLKGEGTVMYSCDGYVARSHYKLIHQGRIPGPQSDQQIVLHNN